MIFVKVSLDLLHHRRLLKIEPVRFRAECLGAWIGALIYTRGAELDGFCPLIAIEHLARPQAIDQLVAVELAVREEQDGIPGIRILRYSEHNETKEQISARRAYDRHRKSKATGANRQDIPSGFPSESKGTSVDSDGNPFGFPGSDSVSVSGSLLQGERERKAGSAVTLVTPGARTPFPVDFVLREESKAAAQMAGLQDVELVWANFRSMAIEKSWAFTREGWDERWSRFWRTEIIYQRERRARAAPLASARPGTMVQPSKGATWTIGKKQQA